MKNQVHFQTQLFNSTEVKPDFINPRCFGEDLADWLAARLGSEHVSCEAPFQEDWGWTLPVQVEGAKFFVNIGLTDEETEVPKWLASVEPRGLAGRFFGTKNSPSRRSLCERLESVLNSTPGISHVEWSHA